MVGVGGVAGGGGAQGGDQGDHLHQAGSHRCQQQDIRRVEDDICVILCRQIKNLSLYDRYVMYHCIYVHNIYLCLMSVRIRKK